MKSIYKKSLVCTAILSIIFIASLFLQQYFLYLTGALLLTVILLWLYIFDISLNWKSLQENSRFLILPIIFNLGSLYLITIFFQPVARAITALFIIIGNYFFWVSLRRVYNLSERAAIVHRNTLIVVSFVSVFLGSTAFFRLYMLLSTSENRPLYQTLLIIMVFALFYLVSSFLTWENGAIEDQKKLRSYSLIISLLGAEVSWITSFWIINYPVISIQEKANLGGAPLPAILLTIVFYFLWGVIFHKLDHSLTRRVLTEYFLISLLFILVLLATARWLPSI